MCKLKNILSAILISGLICSSASAEEEVYSGVYKDHQLLPNTMTTLCKKSAEDMVKNPQELRNCVIHLALKRRDSDAEKAREGLKDLHDIKLDQLLEMISLATAKNVAVSDYYSETAKEIGETNANAKTVNDVDGAAVNTSAQLTSVVNSLRDLYVEQLKYLAISNIENIEKDTLEDVASMDMLNQNGSQSAEKTGETDAQQVESTLKTEKPATEMQFADGVCKLCVQKGGDNWECREQPCPDGLITDSATNKIWECKDGVCKDIEEDAWMEKLQANAQKDIIFYDNANGNGWEFNDGVCEYCESGEAYGKDHKVCLVGCPESGTYPTYRDDMVVVCENRICEAVYKEN